MATRTSRASRQGRESSEGASDSQRPQHSPQAIEEYCNRLAMEIQNIPAIFQGYSTGSEENLNSNAISHTGNQQLIHQLQHASNELRGRDVAISHLQRDLEWHKQEVQNLRAKEQTLRDSVLGNESYQEIGDEELISAYGNLQQGIQKIAASQLFQVEGRILDFEGSAFALGEYLSELWQSPGRKSRMLVLRAVLSQILAERVFGEEFFAISESQEEVGNSEDISTLNAGLGHFEHLLVQYRVPHDIIVNWRLSTLRSIEAAGLKGKVFGTALAEQMCHFFSGLIIEGSTPQNINTLESHFRELCNQAYTLRLLMRKSRQDYGFINISAKPAADDIKQYADVIQKLELGSGCSRRVTLTLCGALVIFLQSPNEQVRVLEKAQVAMIKY